MVATDCTWATMANKPRHIHQSNTRYLQDNSGVSKTSFVIHWLMHFAHAHVEAPYVLPACSLKAHPAGDVPEPRPNCQAQHQAAMLEASITCATTCLPASQPPSHPSTNALRYPPCMQAGLGLRASEEWLLHKIVTLVQR